MLKPESPAYPLCEKIATILRENGKAAAQTAWEEFLNERQAAKKPVVRWEALAMMDTIHGLAKT
jgi:hypothetical protein